MFCKIGNTAMNLCTVFFYLGCFLKKFFGLGLLVCINLDSLDCNWQSELIRTKGDALVTVSEPSTRGEMALVLSFRCSHQDTVSLPPSILISPHFILQTCSRRQHFQRKRPTLPASLSHSDFPCLAHILTSHLEPGRKFPKGRDVEQSNRCLQHGSERMRYVQDDGFCTHQTGVCGTLRILERLAPGTLSLKLWIHCLSYYI